MPAKKITARTSTAPAAGAPGGAVDSPKGRIRAAIAAAAVVVPVEGETTMPEDERTAVFEETCEEFRAKGLKGKGLTPAQGDELVRQIGRGAKVDAWCAAHPNQVPRDGRGYPLISIRDRVVSTDPCHESNLVEGHPGIRLRW